MSRAGREHRDLRGPSLRLVVGPARFKPRTLEAILPRYAWWVAGRLQQWRVLSGLRMACWVPCN
eukprot:14176606-Alexandrium_andersonii.AAC.1